MKNYSFLLTEGFADKHILKVIKHQSPGLYKLVKSGNVSVKDAVKRLGQRRRFDNVKGLLTDQERMEIPLSKVLDPNGSDSQILDDVVAGMKKRHPRAYVDKIVAKGFSGKKDGKEIWKPNIDYKIDYEYDPQTNKAIKAFAHKFDVPLELNYARKKFGFGVYSKDVNDQFYNPMRRFDGFN